MKIRLLWPLSLFLILVVFLVIGLQRDPREIPSPLMNKPAPAFQLSRLSKTNQFFTPKEMLGKVWLFNVWASWCSACRAEHTMWFQLLEQDIPVVGLNYKDEKEQALFWLQELGDPYFVSVLDGQGMVGMEYGVYGVPETFVIDPSGIIRYKHIGPMTQTVLNNTILPLIKKLKL